MPESHGLLSQFALVPPPGGARWTVAASASPSASSVPASAPRWPLFWFDPPWHLTEPDAAFAVADAVAKLGVAVSALTSDMTTQEAALPPWPSRIVPYRAERHGLQLQDLQAAAVLEVRLAATRDAAGRFAYNPRQLQRWLGRQATAANTADAMPAWHWPPELRSLSDLSRKLEQLHRLAPQASRFVSIGPFRLAEEIPLLLDSGADGIILRLDDCCALTGVQTAQLVVLARELIARRGHGPSFPLWIVPPIDPTADDCVKLIALGATAVAIDAWCNPLLVPSPADRSSAWNAAAPGLLSPPAADPLEQFGPDLDRLAGLIHSCGEATAESLNGGHLTTSNQHLAVQLGIRWLLSGSDRPSVENRQGA